MGEFSEHLEYVKLLGYVSLGSIIITYIIHRIFRDFNSAIKYLPGMFFIIFGLYNLYNIGNDLTLSTGISNLVSSMLGLGAGFIALLFGLILGVYNKEKRIKKRKKHTRNDKLEIMDVDTLE